MTEHEPAEARHLTAYDVGLGVDEEGDFVPSLREVEHLEVGLHTERELRFVVGHADRDRPAEDGVGDDVVEEAEEANARGRASALGRRRREVRGGSRFAHLVERQSHAAAEVDEDV